jgi:ferritin-like metal-binding protein YciE
MWRNCDWPPAARRWNRRRHSKFHSRKADGGQGSSSRCGRATQESTTMAKVKSLDDLFVNLLKDIYYAEKQILKALPKMAKHSESAELEEAFLNHLEETKGQVERLEQVFALCELKPAGKTCPAIKGILEEGQEVMKEAETPDVLDAGMIADAQAVEHYEIARYGTLIAWANQLGMREAAALLQETLDQEYTADRILSELAEGRLNREAA